MKAIIEYRVQRVRMMAKPMYTPANFTTTAFTGGNDRKNFQHFTRVSDTIMQAKVLHR